jgi:formylglycine-generating enzyme required for sulfatase activity
LKCPNGCGDMLAGELLWVCGWCGAPLPRHNPAPVSPPEMVEVPAGRFLMGAAEGDAWAQDHEKPCQEIYLSGYEISMYPITNGQYRMFVEATHRQAPAHWEARPPVGENTQHPVCFVSWFDARAYCEWLSETTGDTFTLPTEAQWEKGARGGLWLDGDLKASVPNPFPDRRFPNGCDRLLPAHANFDGLQAGTTPVGRFPEGTSPYGCLEMSGNVSEWCLDTYNPAFYARMPKCDPCEVGEGLKALRGGSWRSGTDHVRCSNRYFYPPDRSSYGIGFRIVRLRT